MPRIKIGQNQRLSEKQKNAKDKQWYKDQADLLTGSHLGVESGYGGVSEFQRMKVNYDLFNNILDLGDFEYVCNPFGAEAGELPARMVNRDISSGKIKALLGMEMKRPFSWKVIATNPEATTRKEQEEFKRIREFVVSEIMKPIRTEIEQQNQAQLQGKELSQQELQQIQAQVEEQTKAATPSEVKKYMQREHQDAAEVLSHQLLEYLIQKCKIKKKFNDAFKHGMLSAKSIMYIGAFNGEPEVWNVNSLRFSCDKPTDSQFIEDGEWAVCEYPMTPSQVVQYFGDEMTQKEIDDLYDGHGYYRYNDDYEDLFRYEYDTEETGHTIRVLHCVWKSLRKVGFLHYTDDEGEEQILFVDEHYKLNEFGEDLYIDWYYIPEAYETWKIGEKLYKKMRPIPGQFKDLDNLHHCKLPYYGVIYDNMNSQATSVMDRLKVYQYYYNIIMYRLEILLASDKGKKVLMNINAVPDSAGIDIKKFQYFMESTPFLWFDPNEEGTDYSDVNTIAKVIDLSLISDIMKYIEIAEYLKKQAGESIGITPQIEGQIGPNDAVANTRQSLIQSSHILEPYFELHNHFKKNVLQALLETAKVTYSNSKPRKLTYVLDDMSVRTIDMDIGLLDNSTLGLFVSSSAKAEEAKDLIRQLAHAALQNQKVELSDVISIVKQEGIVEAEETLKAAEQNRREYEQSMQQQQQQAAKELQDSQQEFEKEKHEMEKEKIVLKEEERRETEITKAALLGHSFNPETDVDDDGVPDFLELAKHGLDAEIKKSKQQLDREKFEHQKMMDKEKLEQDKKKLKSDQSKSSQK